jgi:hypothetical protein
MEDKQGVVREIDWGRILSVGHITKAFLIAVWPPSKLVLCLAALVVTIGAGVVLDQAFGTWVNEKSFCDNMQDVFATALGQGTQWNSTTDLANLQGFWFGPLDAMRGMASLIGSYWSAHPWFALLNTLIAVAVWTFVGGAVCRIVALQFARDERIGIGEALRFACRHYLSLLASPLGLFIVVCLIALPVTAIASAILWIPYAGEVIAGLGFILMLLLGVVLAILTVLAVAGLGLQMPVIAAEGRDSFDAVARSLTYVTNRPWKYVLYTAFSIAYMCVTFVLVRLFAFLTLKIPYAFLSLWWGINSPREGDEPIKLSSIWAEPQMTNLFTMPESGGALGFAAWAIGIVIAIFLGLMVAFIPSFVLSSQTIIYFLLRRMVDLKDLEDVAIEDSGQPTGLERLEKTVETVVEPEPPAAEEGEPEKPEEESKPGADEETEPDELEAKD